MISSTNGRRKGKKRQNDQRCDMLARVKLEDEGISRHGRNTQKLLLVIPSKHSQKIISGLTLLFGNLNNETKYRLNELKYLNKI